MDASDAETIGELDDDENVRNQFFQLNIHDLQGHIGKVDISDAENSGELDDGENVRKPSSSPTQHSLQGHVGMDDVSDAEDSGDEEAQQPPMKAAKVATQSVDHSVRAEINSAKKRRSTRVSMKPVRLVF